MMHNTKPVTGTYSLDGLIQGKVLDYSQELSAWSKSAEAKGVKFDLRFDASDFSLLPNDIPQSFSSIKEGKLEDLISASIEELLNVFDDLSAAQIFSTLRSEKYLDGMSQQSIYRVHNDGKVDYESRVVDVETEAAPIELTNSAKIKIGLFSLLGIFLLFLASTPFINYKGMFADAKDQLTALKANELVIDTSKVCGAFNLTVDSINTRKKEIVLKVERGERWSNLYQVDPNYSFATFDDYNIAVALHKRIRLEWYDKKGKVLAVNYMKVEALVDNESFLQELDVVAKGKISSLVVLPD